MPLVPCKCTNCGANLQVDNTKDAAVCEFCGSAFVVEKAINNYNVTNHISAGVVNVYGGNSSDFEIRGGVLEKYTGSATNVVIPNNVIHIKGGETESGGAFHDCIGVKSVTIPNSVTKIGRYAFSGCTGLTSVTIPDSVTEIGHGAFSGCTSLISIIIPNGVTLLSCFQKCTSLKEITIPHSVTTLSGFSGCTSLTNITIPNSVTVIGNSAFCDCTSLTSVRIPNSVTEISHYAFCGCNSLWEIVIPMSVTKLGYQAFFSCPSLKNVTIFDTVKEIGYNVDGTGYSGLARGLGGRKDSTRENEYYENEGIFKAFDKNNNYIRKTLIDWNRRNLKIHFDREGACYIATAVYGSYDCPPVWTLRRYRDDTLSATRLGRAFIRTYYAVSPALVKWFGHTAWFQKLWRSRLDKLVARLQDQGVKDTPYQDNDS